LIMILPAPGSANAYRTGDINKTTNKTTAPILLYTAIHCLSFVIASIP
jgi:hypothetical protein